MGKLSLSQTTNLDSSEVKEFAEDNCELDRNGRQFSKRVENTAGKGEIARYEQVFLFPQCFQNNCTADTLNTRACLKKGYRRDILDHFSRTRY